MELGKLLGEIQKNGRGVLCVILEKSGSAPREAGAAMAVLPEGKTIGTIGGGAMEFAVIQEALQVLQTKKNTVREFSLDNSRAGDLGMICGGKVKVVFSCLEASDIKAEEKGFLVWNGESWSLQPEPAAGLSLPVNQSPRVYVFGGGHVSQALLPLLKALDFDLTLVEDRPQFAEARLFPEGTQIILEDYEKLDTLPVKNRDYVVILTRGHQGDQAVLEQLLSRNPCYIGCIGSRKKAAESKKKLLEAGFSQEETSAVHCPIGLAIGAQTPAEIAVSIAAEIIQWRNRI